MTAAASGMCIFGDRSRQVGIFWVFGGYLVGILGGY